MTPEAVKSGLSRIRKRRHSRNWLSDSQRARINRFRIPVDSFNPGTYWIVSLDYESYMPTAEELDQLRSYQEFAIKRVYNETYINKLMSMPLPKCGGHNTLIFRKGLRRLGFRDMVRTGWSYRRISWSEGPTYVPDIHKYQYTLVQLLDTKIEDLCPDKWQVWKSEHPSIFPKQSEQQGVV